MNISFHDFEQQKMLEDVASILIESEIDVENFLKVYNSVYGIKNEVLELAALPLGYLAYKGGKKLAGKLIPSYGLNQTKNELVKLLDKYVQQLNRYNDEMSGMQSYHAQNMLNILKNPKYAMAQLMWSADRRRKDPFKSFFGQEDEYGDEHDMRSPRRTRDRDYERWIKERKRAKNKSKPTTTTSSTPPSSSSSSSMSPFTEPGEGPTVTYDY